MSMEGAGNEGCFFVFDSEKRTAVAPEEEREKMREFFVERDFWVGFWVVRIAPPA